MSSKDTYRDGFKNTALSTSSGRLSRNLEVFGFLEHGNRNLIDKFRQYAGYYTGSKQWTDEERLKLEGEGRPPLVFNLVFSKVNVVSGVEQQIRSGFRAIPIGVEDEELAKLATHLLYYEDYNKKLQKVFSRAFKTAITCGRAWIDVSVEQQMGELTMSNKVKNESVYNVYSDPDGKEFDLSDSRYLARFKWLSTPQLKMLYPDLFMNKSTDEMHKMLNFSPDPRYKTRAVEFVNDYPTNPNINDWTAYVDNERRRAKIIELYTKKVEYQWYIMGIDGNMIPAKNKREADEKVVQLNQQASQMQMQQGQTPQEMFSIVKTPECKVYQDVFSGNMLLRREEILPYNHQQFPIVPIYAYLEDTGDKIENFGIVKNLIDPQDEKNKRHSQFTDILNRAPKGGGFYQQSAVDAEQIQNLSSPGTWVGVRGSIKDKVMPSNANYIGILGHYQWLEQSAENDVKEISGINDSLIGIPTGSRESGVAAQQRIQQGVTSLQELFDNLNTGKKLVINQILSNIQQFYDPNKIKKIVGVVNRDNPDDTIQAIPQLIESFYDIKYDIAIDEGETSPTARIAAVQSATELLQYAQAMPPAAVMTIVKSIVEMSRLPNKQDMLADLSSAEEAMMMQQAAGEQEGQGGQKRKPRR
mgnify:CR=1 FL=1